MLGALHALTGAAWFAYKNVAQLVTSDDAVCWPLFPACEAVRAHLTPGSVKRIVAVYIALGVASAIAFLRRQSKAAILTLLGTTALGLAVYLLDYRLRFNQTYMLAWMLAAFFLASRKVETLSAMLVAFYVAAGFLKLNTEWLSGAALYARPWLVPDSLVPASCAYVVVLELVLVWGLFSRRAIVRRAVLAQLALFHVVSWPVVGWFYPLQMLGLLSLFVMGEPVSLASLRGSLGFLGAFAAMQLVPALYRGDAAMTGEGRLFALHMFDARVSCTGGAEVRAPGQEVRTLALAAPGSDVRSQCDPIIVLAHARRVCREPWARAEGVRVDVAVDAKRAADRVARPLVRIEDVCKSSPSYTLFGENPWIVAR